MAFLTDARRRGWFWVENAIMDEGWVAKMGAHTFAVYCVLLRCADSGGRAFPSHDYLAEKSGVSLRQVPRALGRLKKLELLEVVKKGGGSKGSNIYRILPVDEAPQDDKQDGQVRAQQTITKKRGPTEPLEPFVFQRAKEAYPRQAGVSWLEAIRAWNARIKEGIDAEVMAQGVERYRAYCLALRTEQRFIKLPATFFGPSQHFKNDWTPPEDGAKEERRVDMKAKKTEDLMEFYENEVIT